MSAWLELDGRPRNQVTRFHVIAPTRPARMISSVIASWRRSTFAISWPRLEGHERAGEEFRTAAIATACRGPSARVDTVVAIELAVSWKPFVK